MYLNLRREEKRSYSKQLYQAIREKILKGDLNGGDALPSTRELSAELSIARNTVLAAYEMLVSEGFAKSSPGSGIYVSNDFLSVQDPGTIQRTGALQKESKLNDHAAATLADYRLTSGLISFDSGIPALEYFPRSKWNSCVSSAFRGAPVSALGYDDPQGRTEFRTVLAGWLKKSRGLDCSPDQIIITAGAKQGLTLIAKCLLHPDSEVLIEDPSNRNVVQIFSYHTPHITPVPVDKEGLRTDMLPADKSPALLFTTPSHQFPLGGILPICRRLELAAYARKTDCILVEDDYDSEFRYDGTPVSSLFELAPERTIYVGTFSKLLFPSLRMGYLVLPPTFVSRFREWKRLSDHHTSSINQLAMIRFIENGDLEHHIRRMKKLYRNRRDFLLALLDSCFSHGYQVHGGSAGMHIVLELDGVVFSKELIHELYESGVYAVPVEDHAIKKGLHQNRLILGYAQLSCAEMGLGLQKIKSVLIGKK